MHISNKAMAVTVARKSSFVLFSVTLVLVILTEIHAYHVEQQGDNQTHGFSEGSLHPQDCAPRCTTRCSETSFKKPCMFFCQKCCAKCLCVPPGTYGNKQVCPCYNNWKTKEGSPKCP